MIQLRSAADGHLHPFDDDGPPDDVDMPPNPGRQRLLHALRKRDDHGRPIFYVDAPIDPITEYVPSIGERIAVVAPVIDDAAQARIAAARAEVSR